MSKFLQKVVLPTTWSPQTEEVIEVELSPSSQEYENVRELLCGEARDQLERITRVQNPYLYARYLLRKAEYAVDSPDFKERTWLHATSAYKVNSIITENLDWRKVSRCKFGKGVSFSPSAEYANKECSRNNGDNRAMIVNKVLTRTQTNGYSFTTIPPPNYDTTTDRCGNVYVKYYDDEFYPEYVAYYRNTLRYYKRFFH